MRDVVEAFRLLEVAMQQSATDHATGQINLAWLGFVHPLLFFFLTLQPLVLTVCLRMMKRYD